MPPREDKERKLERQEEQPAEEVLIRIRVDDHFVRDDKVARRLMNVFVPSLRDLLFDRCDAATGRRQSIHVRVADHFVRDDRVARPIMSVCVSFVCDVCDS